MDVDSNDSEQDVQQIIYDFLILKKKIGGLPNRKTLYRIADDNRKRLAEIKSKADVNLPLQRGRPRLLHIDLEEDLAKKIREFIEMDYGITPLQVRIYAWEVMATLMLGNKTKYGMGGFIKRGPHSNGGFMSRGWWRRFKNKYSFTKLCKPRESGFKCESEQVNSFFSTLISTMNELSLTTADVFNVDETMCDFRPKTCRVITSPILAEQNRKNDTVPEVKKQENCRARICASFCVSWAGEMLPPYFLVGLGPAISKEKATIRFQLYLEYSYAEAQGPEASLIALNANGWHTASTFMDVSNMGVTERGVGCKEEKCVAEKKAKSKPDKKRW